MQHARIGSYVLRCIYCCLLYRENATSAWIEAVMTNKQNLTTICVFCVIPASFTSITSSIKRPWRFLTCRSLTLTKIPSSFSLKNQESVICSSGMIASNYYRSPIEHSEHCTSDSTNCCRFVWWTPDFLGQWQWCSADHAESVPEITHSTLHFLFWTASHICSLQTHVISFFLICRFILSVRDAATQIPCITRLFLALTKRNTKHFPAGAQ